MNGDGITPPRHELTDEEHALFAAEFIGDIERQLLENKRPYDCNYVLWVMGNCGQPISTLSGDTPLNRALSRVIEHKDEQTSNDEYEWRAFPL